LVDYFIASQQQQSCEKQGLLQKIHRPPRKTKSPPHQKVSAKRIKQNGGWLLKPKGWIHKANKNPRRITGKHVQISKCLANRLIQQKPKRVKSSSDLTDNWQPYFDYDSSTKPQERIQNI
jgi:hypothetical protein